MTRNALAALVLCLILDLSTAAGAQFVPGAPLSPPVADSVCVASDGHGFLVVWSSSANFGSFLQLLDAGGRPLLPSSAMISPSFDTVYGVASNGNGYAVLLGGANGLYVMRVTPDGRQMPPVLVRQRSLNAAIASARGGYLMLVDSAIRLLDGDARPLGGPINVPGGAPWTALATDGTDYVLMGSVSVCPNCGTKIVAVRVAANGVYDDSWTFAVEPADLSSSVQAVFDGKEYVAAWSRENSTYRAVLSPYGLVAVARAVANQPIASLAAMHDGSLLLLRQGNAVTTLRLGPGGEPLDGEPQALAAKESIAAAATNAAGDTFVVQGHPLQGRFLAGAEALHPIAMEPRPQEVIGLVTAGDSDLVAWREGTSAEPQEIVAMRVRNGAPSGPRQVIASLDASRNVSIVAAGNRVLFYWPATPNGTAIRYSYVGRVLEADDTLSPLLDLGEILTPIGSTGPAFVTFRVQGTELRWSLSEPGQPPGSEKTYTVKNGSLYPGAFSATRGGYLVAFTREPGPSVVVGSFTEDGTLRGDLKQAVFGPVPRLAGDGAGHTLLSEWRQAVILDDDGNVTAGPLDIPIAPFGAVWTGTDFLLHDGREVMRLDSALHVLPPPANNLTAGDSGEVRFIRAMSGRTAALLVFDGRTTRVALRALVETNGPRRRAR